MTPDRVSLPHLITVAAALLGPLAIAQPASAICRRVGKTGSPPAVVHPDQPVLLVKYDNLSVSCEGDPGGDAGPVGDGGIGDGGIGDAGPADAGAPDSGPLEDANVGDGGPGDAPPCLDYDGPAVSMTVQPRLSIGSDGTHFALIMATPSRPAVDLANPDVFVDLAETTAPRVIIDEVYVEDESLGYQCCDPKWNSSGGGGCGGGGGGYYDPGGGTTEYGDPPDLPEPDTGASLEKVGPFEIAIIEATNSYEVAAWLDEFEYLYNAEDIEAIGDYVYAGWTVLAVRVSADAAEGGVALQPLRFTYAGDELRLPVGISRQKGGGESFLTTYVAAEGRYEFPEGAVTYAQWNDRFGGEFLTRADLWVDLSRSYEDDPIAEKAANVPIREVVSVEQEVFVPSSSCPDSCPSSSSGGCESDEDDDDVEFCGCRIDSRDGSGLLGFGLLVAACAAAFRRRRSRPRRRS